MNRGSAVALRSTRSPPRANRLRLGRCHFSSRARQRNVDRVAVWGLTRCERSRGPIVAPSCVPKPGVWRCHRRIIADDMLGDVSLMHITRHGKVDSARAYVRRPLGARRCSSVMDDKSSIFEGDYHRSDSRGSHRYSSHSKAAYGGLTKFTGKQRRSRCCGMHR